MDGGARVGQLTFSMSVDVAQPKLGIVGSKWKNRPKKIRCDTVAIDV
jgi:hypothetical protein